MKADGSAAMRDVVVVGGSAGAHAPLREIVAGLDGFDGTVLVALHLAPDVPSVLPALLARAGSLPARHARDGEPLPRRTILVAPPNHHLLVTPEGVRLSTGPKESGTRPAVDALFRTAGVSLGPRVVGVVLSGALDDGTTGLATIKARGGVSIVQSPEEARFHGMIESAREHVDVDYVLPAAQIASKLLELSTNPVDAGMGVMTKPRGLTKSRVDDEQTASELARTEGVPGERLATVLSCPECHGVLMRLINGEPPRLLHFKCQTGHTYSPLALLREEREDLCDSLE